MNANMKEDAGMKRAVIQIRRDQDAKTALAAMGENFVKAWNSGKASDPVATFTFSSPAQLFTVLSPKRWELIEHLQKIGPQSVRGLARSLQRDVKRVHEHHLRLWYALGDLYERAGDIPRARDMFDRVAKRDRAFADVAERLAALR